MITIEKLVTIKARGRVEIAVDGKVVKRLSNDMLAGLGYIWADALSTGTCKMITNMFAHQQGGWGRIEFSTPTTTAGGTGAEDDITVQSTWTNATGSSVTLDKFWLSAEPFDTSADYLDIAIVDNDTITVPNSSTVTINWTIEVPSATCQFEADQRYELVKGINPDGAGTIYKISKGRFVWSGGDSGLTARQEPPVGGGGYTQSLIIDVRYTHSGATVTVTEAEFYNAHDTLVQERTSLSYSLADTETARMLLTIQCLGVNEGGGGDTT